ncbi:MAG: hypothetical protein PHH83_01205 [Patescibacteria group bacterium]|nr:hypothetical protein [Patescibacteria group bacterium]
MNQEKWKDVKAKILDSFDVINQYTNTDDDNHGILEVIEFKSPAGEMKVEFHERDLVLDKHTNYSNRIGSGVSVDYIYSNTEKTYSLKAYKKVNDDWEQIEAPSFVS